MLTVQEKDKIIKKFATHKNDTGSPEVQCAILTSEIKQVTVHLKKNKKDIASRRGLLQMVNKRRKLLNYLKKEDEKRYQTLIKKLKLKK